MWDSSIALTLTPQAFSNISWVQGLRPRGQSLSRCVAAISLCTCKPPLPPGLAPPPADPKADIFNNINQQVVAVVWSCLLGRGALAGTFNDTHGRGGALHARGSCPGLADPKPGFQHESKGLSMLQLPSAA